MNPILTRPGTEHEEYIYSNSYGVISWKVAHDLQVQPNTYARHAATHFTGYVWYDRVTGYWYEEVCRYHHHIKTMMGPDLEKLISGVNREYGQA